MLERRHVDHVAARQRNVRSDARALLSERLLGDLNDDLLAFLQQLGDGWQGGSFGTALGTAKRSGFGTLFGTARGWFSGRAFAARLVGPGFNWGSGFGSSVGSSVTGAAATHLAAHAARQAVHIAATLLTDLSGERRGAGRRLFCSGFHGGLSPGGLLVHFDVGFVFNFCAGLFSFLDSFHCGQQLWLRQRFLGNGRVIRLFFYFLGNLRDCF